MSERDWANVESIAFLFGAFFCAGMGRYIAAILILAFYAVIYFISENEKRSKPPTTD